MHVDPNTIEPLSVRRGLDLQKSIDQVQSETFCL